jgi:very-short-patch-repair endonuclease
MWTVLRDRRLADSKFRRQHVIDNFILDFYCHEKKIAVELDGGQHNTPEGSSKDMARDAALAKQGIRVLRFWNNEVLQDTEAVMERLWEVLTDSIALTPNPSPAGRGEHGGRRLHRRHRSGERGLAVHHRVFAEQNDLARRGGCVCHGPGRLR